MSRDAMTPRERLAAYAQGKAIDRLPCVPIVGNTAARVLGVPVRRIRSDGRLLAEAQIAAWRRFGYDTVRVFTDLYVLAEAMGAQVTAPEDETAYLRAPAVEKLADIAELRPVVPHFDGLLPEHLEAMHLTVKAIGHLVPVTGGLTGPFTTASFLVGAENLGRLLLRNPEAVHQLCRLTTESALRYAEAMLEVGCTPSLTEPMASATVISPRQFREFVLPYLRRLVDFIHRCDRPVTLHICGRTEKIWDAMAESGADTLSLDNDIDLAAASARIGGRVRLMGNVHPTAVMLQGAPETVRQAVHACIRQGAGTPRGFIVASGCSLPTETPFANIDAMMDAVREAGWPPAVPATEPGRTLRRASGDLP